MKKNLKSLRLISYVSSAVLVSCIYTTNAFAADTVVRLAGQDRYETAAEICKKGWSQSDYAVLSSGENFPDALCAAPLAKKYNAPILLTSKNELNTNTKNELIRLKVKQVFITGGTGSVSAQVEKALNSMKIKTVRFAGKDRYETALKVAGEIGINSNGICIVNGNDFPDALSISSIAAVNGMPIVLVPKDSLTNELSSYIKQNSITKTYVIGDENSISEHVAKIFPNSKRLSTSQENRYLGNTSIIQQLGQDLSTKNSCIASGENFPDGLAGSAFAAKLNSPIVLTDGQTARNWVYKGTDATYLFGGPASISKDFEAYINGTLKDTDIASIDDVSVDTELNSNYELPASVKAVLLNGTTTDAAITWDESAIDTSKIGTYKFNGTVKDYNKDVTLNLNVVDTNTLEKGNLSGNIFNGQSAAQKGDFVYTISGNGIKKINTTKTTSSLIRTSGSVESINVAGDWIYYQNSNDPGVYPSNIGSGIRTMHGKIYKIKTDGTNDTKLCDDVALYPTVVEDWIYYINLSDNGNLYKIKTDGSNKTSLNKDTVSFFDISGGYIYYKNDSDNAKLYKIKTDGSNRTSLTTDSVSQIIVIDNYVYYISSSDNYKLHKIQTDGTNDTTLTSTGVRCFNTAKDYIYYVGSDAQSINKVKIDGSDGSTFVQGTGIKHIYVLGDWIYYSSSSNNIDYKTYKVKLDGSSNQMVSNLTIN
ncbi:cell wall-binding repeat-containing protein [Clostridium sp. DJ247]|uniref:cell wall-binding repeat-containing protein n=1 Tax=Clostridium sp. DJ247 TaxID=2726188 RepID=UPI001625905C|nr:cell wall-binding repeat-containing protein [Clostridium sp. DJ247]MBC2580174.1 DUF5050 domain-containing protein [Clostridium sp. DJ247]